MVVNGCCKKKFSTNIIKKSDNTHISHKYNIVYTQIDIIYINTDRRGYEKSGAFE